MNTTLDPNIRRSLMLRVQSLSDQSAPEWGKMSLSQMLRHCIKNEELLLQDRAYPRTFIGRIFGGMVKRSMLKNEKPLAKNQPTHPDLIIQGEGDPEAEVTQWQALIDRYGELNSQQYATFVHPFFGKMTMEEVGIAAYKHIDHHLRQFGA
ncbi:MAG: DUF1569 domain-containing protein [Bacteroidota bacterium]